MKLIAATLIAFTALTGAALAKSEIRVVQHGHFNIHTYESTHAGGPKDKRTSKYFGNGIQTSYYSNHAPADHCVVVEPQLAGFTNTCHQFPEDGKTLVIEFWGTVFKVDSQNKIIDGIQDNGHAQKTVIK